MIGSSLLIVHDGLSRVSSWMIDFAKTRETEFELNHRTEWTLGNSEDGVLIGIDNLIMVKDKITNIQVRGFNSHF